MLDGEKRIMGIQCAGIPEASGSDREFDLRDLRMLSHQKIAGPCGPEPVAPALPPVSRRGLVSGCSG